MRDVAHPIRKREFTVSNITFYFKFDSNFFYKWTQLSTVQCLCNEAQGFLFKLIQVKYE